MLNQHIKILQTELNGLKLQGAQRATQLSRLVQSVSRTENNLALTASIASQNIKEQQ